MACCLCRRRKRRRCVRVVPVCRRRAAPSRACCRALIGEAHPPIVAVTGVPRRGVAPRVSWCTCCKPTLSVSVSCACPGRPGQGTPCRPPVAATWSRLRATSRAQSSKRAIQKKCPAASAVVRLSGRSIGAAVRSTALLAKWCDRLTGALDLRSTFPTRRPQRSYTVGAVSAKYMTSQGSA